MYIYIYIHIRTSSLKHKRVLWNRCRCKHTDGTLCLQINRGTNEYLIASHDGAARSQFQYIYILKYPASNYFYFSPNVSSLFSKIHTYIVTHHLIVSMHVVLPIFSNTHFLVSSRNKLDQDLIVVAVAAAVVVVYDRSPISKRKALNTKFRPREEINRPETRVGRNLHLRYQFTIKLR